jgi:hypothetical protein
MQTPLSRSIPGRSAIDRILAGKAKARAQFLSCSLTWMRQVLPVQDFCPWLNRFSTHILMA